MIFWGINFLVSATLGFTIGYGVSRESKLGGVIGAIILSGVAVCVILW